MTGQEALRRATATLRMHDIDDPEIEAEVLLRHVLQLDRTYLFLRLPDELTEEQAAEYHRLIGRRVAHTPAAYLTERREFYSLSFAVGPGVLIPRPETEHLVEAVLEAGREMLCRQDRVTCVDVGTGSGAIALAVAKHAPALRVLATDVSIGALAIAGLNAKRLRLAGRVTLLEGDLLEPVAEPVDIIVANLPYIPTEVWTALPSEIRDHEPRVALDGGEDGLRIIDRLLSAVPRHLAPGGVVILEIAYDQGPVLRALVAERLPGATTEIRQDLAGHDRVAVIRPW
ncbi:MAG: peptide chain release factor N(5)-glutamine methyltransferase [Dehalococcoidia bacterium]